MQPDDIVVDEQTFVPAELFREAMSRLGAPVTVVATDGPAGRQGLTVSAITSVSDTPPTVLVCLNRSNRSHEAFRRNGVVGISILGRGHDDVAGVFASSRRTPEEKFASGVWRVGKTGAPLLDDAAVTLDCVIEDIRTSGTHDVLFCAVRDIVISDAVAAGLAWCGRTFHHLPFAPLAASLKVENTV
ncbi:FMN reductase (NADH) RutF [Acetobacter aceti NBRC 14818]|uniref:FMN reductase (NADH) RutF n=3 Tax=Acetobacter aceti TaxID=435 RepID=A0AB33IDN3_ACEAC|nr:flavin reductase [Acetobacter aceti]BCK75866.1 FMN reductase (NADH) RutF [Acetobacter aceti NBRC 14818]